MQTGLRPGTVHPVGHVVVNSNSNLVVDLRHLKVQRSQASKCNKFKMFQIVLAMTPLIGCPRRSLLINGLSQRSLAPKFSRFCFTQTF